MKHCTFALLIVLSCTSCSTPRVRDTAPFKAVIVFEWLPDEIRETELATTRKNSFDSEAEVDAFAPPLERTLVENEFIRGLDEYGVFSDFVIADWDDMDGVAAISKADLIVLVRIGSLADWNPQEARADPGLAVLDGVLWFATAIGGWWVPGRVFPTRSDIEVLWARPDRSGELLSNAPPRPQRAADIRSRFRQGDRLSSGEYKLSLFQRAKIWRSPGTYLVNLFVPATLSPFHDENEVSRSLALAAIDDLKRDLAQKLDRSSLRAAGAPFTFRLEEPRNGSTVAGSTTTLRYSYQLESGFEEHWVTKLSGLRIELLREGEREYRTLSRYQDASIRDINRHIGENASIEEVVDGLGPGLNLIRFAAKLARTDRWVTNTVALRRS